MTLFKDEEVISGNKDVAFQTAGLMRMTWTEYVINKEVIRNMAKKGHF